MKKTFLKLLLIAFLLIPATVMATGTTTAVPHLVGRNHQPYIVITATADSSTALFLPIFFNSSTNAGAYTNILGRRLVSVRTTISALTAPTANYDIYIVEASDTDDFVLTSPTLDIGSTKTNVATAAVNFIINGVQYYKGAVAAGTIPGNDVIVATKYGAVAFDIGANGTIDAIEATDQAAQQFTTAALAIAAVPACASDHVRLGYVTASKSDGTFTFGAGGTDFDAANTTVAYTSTIPYFDIADNKLLNRSATATEKVYFVDSDGSVEYPLISGPFMVILVNNSVNSAVVGLSLDFD